MGSGRGAGGHDVGMTDPTGPRPSIADVAQESPEKSVAEEREAVGDQPDTGDVVDEDSAQ